MSTGSPTSKPWLLLAVAASLYIGFGLVAASLSPLVGTINDDLGLSRSQMGAVLGSWQFVYLFAAIPAGKFLDRFGLRTGLAVGSALIAASGLLRALAVDWFSLIGAVGVFGLGGPLVSIGVPTLVSLRFEGSDRGLATGIAVSGPVVGSMVTLLSANAFLMPALGESWRAVVAVYAMWSVAAAVVWLMVSARVGDANNWQRSDEGRVSNRALLDVGIVRLILVLAILTFFITHAIANWLPEMLRDHGLSPTSAGVWAAVISIPGLAAALVVPRMARPSRRRVLLIGVYCMLGVGLIPLAVSWSALTAGGILLFGAMRAVALPIAMLFLMDDERVGPTNMAGAGALYFTAGEIGGVSGPVVVGIVADASGFGPAIWIMVAVAAVMAALASRL